MEKISRLYVEKKQGYDVEAQHLLYDIQTNLGITNLKSLRIFNRYDISGVEETTLERASTTIFSEPPVDEIYLESIGIDEDERLFAVEYLPGQYDQRADSAAQCIQILTQQERPTVMVAKVICIKGEITELEFQAIKSYCINAVDSREADLEKPEHLDLNLESPKNILVVEGFIYKNAEELQALLSHMGLAMNIEDLYFCQAYFRNEEKRDPTMTEIRVIDTYWSDHCRHTTFLTSIEDVKVEEGHFSVPIQKAYEEYLRTREQVYQGKEKDLCLMDIAVIGMKELRRQGKLEDLDVSEEINACSIVVPVDVDGQTEEWLVMFKNETHNHPTEIEPFGGAATCLGGAIRDPLSGRAYVYQAMRVTGSGDPRTTVEDTLPGKLPQRKITVGAAHGYSSYGNQIGLATGHVSEIYDEGFVAKRMEIGAVIAAAPKENVVRETPAAGDLIILVGGRTGRDGCGGATGSSKEHTEESIITCGAEVQKGNPPTERKIQRLFRNPEVSRMIKRCNDFGAGGVSVAIGELAEGLIVNLDAVPKKYEGLDGTELAISESQERMAVVVQKDKTEQFIAKAAEENLEAVVVAEVTKEPRLVMHWRQQPIVDISRGFLNTNGAKQRAKVLVQAPKKEKNFFCQSEVQEKDLKKAWLFNLQDLNVCSQKGLVERFDSTIGAGTVLMPFGGSYQLTPAEAMVAKIPVLQGETKTGTIMTYGYNPTLSRWSPFHGAVYAVIEAVSKVVAVGGDHTKIRLTLQEYFEKLGKEPKRWGKPFGALLGAFYAQLQLQIPAIGGKDSMSGTFKELDVPPTLVAFAVDPVQVDRIISPEFKRAGSQVVYIPLLRDQFELPDFVLLHKTYRRITACMQAGRVLAAHTVKTGGIAEAISKMSFGNHIGVQLDGSVEIERLFSSEYGSMILEVDREEAIEELLEGIEYRVLGSTQRKAAITVQGMDISIQEMLSAWEKPLESTFPTNQNRSRNEKLASVRYERRNTARSSTKLAKPRIFIPVFPGTNCEYDTQKAFEKAGGIVEPLIIRNLTARDIESSLEQMIKKIKAAQIIMLPGGFSAGDEPDGSGKFIATAFRNPRVREAVMDLLKNRDGLMLGICNGFQALIKLGLVPFGEIRDVNDKCPTLTFNTIGRHVSCMVQTQISSTLSPWFQKVAVGDIHTIPVSHGEGRFVASTEMIDTLIKNGQIATQYVDKNGEVTYDPAYNPNGSYEGIEGITSPDGRILGKMGHSERIGSYLYKNVPGEKDQKIFRSGIEYFQ